ncbi:MAG TPA: DUF4350 domain-containing protein [Candidatus Limnocylindrales bacterium]|nr:DUF4350 domain-containing protein [Candidatus Limnocylindrales bacterium]
MTPKRRWFRGLTPLVVVLTLIALSVTLHSLAQPDTGEAHYLSPQPSGHQPTSGEQLADLLRTKGITIKRETRSSDALMATWALKGQATLFIPTPEYMHPDYLWMLRRSPTSTRVVLVEPNARQVYDAVPVLGVGDTRWTSRVASPGRGCSLTTAGRAGVFRTRYGALRKAEQPPRVCYDNGLVAIDYMSVEFVLAGSADPFRTDRIAEHDNAKLAVDLLSTKPTVVWLDLHVTEPKPKTYSENPGLGQPLPSLQPGNERTRPDASPRPESSFSSRPERGAGLGEAEEPESPFADWLLPLVLMLLLTFIALAFARGRRLGAPVTEPLPIDVRGAETALGRAKLYRRAKARGAALETLRVEARRRLAAALKTGTDREQLLDALVTRTGHPRDWLETVLFGPEPEDDSELETRTNELLRLVQQVTRE